MMPAHVRDIAVHGTRWRVYRALSGHEDRCHRTLSIITRHRAYPSPKARSRTLGHAAVGALSPTAGQWMGQDAVMRVRFAGSGDAFGSGRGAGLKGAR
jgi:hypothetical protein